jgi:hypothetical protein
MTCRAFTAPGICFKALIANGKNMTNSNEVGERREAPLRTPSLLGAEDVRNITASAANWNLKKRRLRLRCEPNQFEPKGQY